MIFRPMIHSKLPFLIKLLGKPLYKLSLFRYKLIKFLFRRSEILKGKWMDLNFRMKLLKGIVIYSYVFIYILYLVFIRGINSLALSINTFSTLGFGDIPVVGVSRYLAIIEGFIGWFLLSIFSVSLISQILQL